MNDDNYDMATKSNYFTIRHAFAKKILLPFVDDLIVVDSRLAKYFQKKYQKGIWFPIIYDPILLRKRYHSLLSQSNEYITKYELSGKKVLLFVGRLVTIKNVAFVLKNFLKLNYPNSVFVIVGDGAERQYLEQISHNSSNVIFTGRLEGNELYAWYNVAQLFILPSLLEPFGAVVSEALIAGCKVIVSRQAGSSCLIQDGTNGGVFNPRDSTEFLKYIIKNLDESNKIEYPLSKLRADCLQVNFGSLMNTLFSHL